ncbi:MAG: proline/glycine betaine ABC transporter permease [Actinomycetota bacterium]|nr:proline/glycine betaine ABC transporter permease [Actinomycetota bacterium]
MLAFLQQNLIPEIPLDDWTSSFVRYIQHVKVIDDFFDFVKDAIGGFVGGFEALLTAPPVLVMIALLVVIAYLLSGWRVALFALLGFLLLVSLGLWEASMLSLALVLASTVIALIIGVPLGILAAKSRVFEAAARPTLDIMQTMPAFVYLVPMVVFLGLGAGPALVATVIFAAPPAVRLTLLGIRQVPKNTVEAAQAFGATPWQTLRKVELPQALPTIMAGVNQVIMLALSMVVIAALVGAGGLGETVVRGLSQLDVGRAFIGGVGIVIIAIYLDRVTRNLGRRPSGRKRKRGISKLLPRTKGRPDPQADDAEGDAEADTEVGVGAGTGAGSR